MDEKLLIQQAKAGDFSAFQKLVDSYQQRLYALAMRMTRNRQDAEDIVQETLLKAIDNLEQFRSDSSFGTWLYSIALNTGRNYLIHQKRRELQPIEEFLEGKPHQHDNHSLHEWRDPHSVMESKEIRNVIMEALAELPPEYSVPFSLRYDDELSIKEIAQLLNLTEAATKSRILRARLFLRDKLDSRLKIEDHGEKVR